MIEAYCARCGKLIVWLEGHKTWYTYPLMHGPGSGVRMYEKSVCYRGWLIVRNHKLKDA